MNKNDRTNKNTDDQCNGTTTERGLGSPQNQSKEARAKQDRIFDPLGTRRFSDRTLQSLVRRREIAGGILSQLIEEAADQLAHLQSQTQKVEKRLIELRQLKEQLDETPNK